MHTLYTDGNCARKWRDIATLGKRQLDEEVHRAMEYKYNKSLSRPDETVYKYWEAAW